MAEKQTQSNNDNRSREQILEEMRKYNQDLEKHLPKFDFDSLQHLSFSNPQASSSSDQTDDEYFSLLANNLMELRTEVSLTRKNLISDVEGMIVRTIHEQQNHFLEQMKKFNSSVIMELKENLSNHVESLTEDINALKRRYSELAMQNESMEKNVEQIRSDVETMKEQVEQTNADTHKASSFTRTKLDELHEKLEYISHDVSKGRDHVNKSLSYLSKKTAKIEHDLDNLMYPLPQSSTQQQRPYQVNVPERATTSTTPSRERASSSVAAEQTQKKSATDTSAYIPPIEEEDAENHSERGGTEEPTHHRKRVIGYYGRRGFARESSATASSTTEEMPQEVYEQEAEAEAPRKEDFESSAPEQPSESSGSQTDEHGYPVGRPLPEQSSSPKEEVLPAPAPQPRQSLPSGKQETQQEEQQTDGSTRTARSRFNRLLDIDEKLQKLDSLR